jgi:hypothetical protein
VALRRPEARGQHDAGVTHDEEADMSEVDTLKTGGGQTVSFATARFESRSLLPEQLTDLLNEALANNVDVDMHVEDHGTGPAAK